MKPNAPQPRKIVLGRQTLRVLSSRQLTEVAGGATIVVLPDDSIDGHCTLSNAVRCAAIGD